MARKFTQPQKHFSLYFVNFTMHFFPTALTYAQGGRGTRVSGRMTFPPIIEITRRARRAKFMHHAPMPKHVGIGREGLRRPLFSQCHSRTERVDTKHRTGGHFPIRPLDNVDEIEFDDSLLKLRSEIY